MRRSFLLVLLPILSACVAPRGSSATGAPRQPPPGPAGAPAPPAQAPGGPLPAGIYDVRELVLFDTCHPTRSLPPQVTVMKTHRDGVARASVPVASFGEAGRATKRLDLDVRGYQASGMSHPKICPGAQHSYREQLRDVTPYGFSIQVDYEVADGWDCPNARPMPMCRTSVVYSYRLASAACDARCDGTVPGRRDDDVPDGPVALTCSCR